MTSLYRTTQDLLINAGIHPKKRLGQNFLIEKNIFDFIIQSSNLSSDDIILELGSGIGLLTHKLALSSGKVIAVELDYGLFRILQSRCGNLDNVLLLNTDMLELDFTKLFDEHCQGNKIKVIGNLPYYIITPIILSFLKKRTPHELIRHCL